MSQPQTTHDQEATFATWQSATYAHDFVDLGWCADEDLDSLALHLLQFAREGGGASRSCTQSGADAEGTTDIPYDYNVSCVCPQYTPTLVTLCGLVYCRCNNDNRRTTVWPLQWRESQA